MVTGLKVQDVVSLPDGNTETIKYMDYKDVDGVKIPFNSTFQAKGGVLSQAKINSVQINKGISDTEFNVQ